MRYSEIFENDSNDKILNFIKTIPNDLIILRNNFTKYNFDIRFVGGCVRDVIAGNPINDIDLCTNATPEEQIRIYKDNGYHYIETGLQHGTITVVINNELYEITSLRTETEHDGRHATVAYTRNWVEDLSRRDLTVNAISLTFDGNIIDPFNGVDDLKHNIVKFVGSAEDRITEDYLRILRLFRFHARYSNQPRLNRDERAAVIKLKDGLNKISKERIWMEISKIISGINAKTIINEMVSTGIADTINAHFKNIDALDNKKSDIDPAAILAAVIGDKDEFIKIAKDWKLSNAELKKGTFVSEHIYNTDTSFYYSSLAVDGVPREYVMDLIKLQKNYSLLNTIKSWTIPVFPVNGNDLISIGIKQGPEMGKIMSALKSKWKDANYSISKDELLADLINE